MDCATPFAEEPDTISAMDRNGDAVWSNSELPIGGEVKIFPTGDKVYVASEYFLHSLDAKTGESEWSIDLNGLASVVYRDNGKLHVFTPANEGEREKLYTIDPESGEVLK